MSDHPARIRCFFIEPTGRSQVSLRRFRFAHSYLRNSDGSFKTEKRGDKEVLLQDPDYKGKCTAKPEYGCDASVVIGECEASNRAVYVTEEMKTDPQWPTVCEACGQPFKPEDEWQWNERELYIRKDTGELCILGKAPVGAMWYSDWMADHHNFFIGPDGHILTLNTPGGHWCLDQTANNGPRDKAGWTRTGAPPDVTANPSIICNDYHGWLRNGWLEKC